MTASRGDSAATTGALLGLRGLQFRWSFCMAGVHHQLGYTRGAQDSGVHPMGGPSGAQGGGGVALHLDGHDVVPRHHGQAQHTRLAARERICREQQPRVSLTATSPSPPLPVFPFPSPPPHHCPPFVTPLTRISP